MGVYLVLLFPDGRLPGPRWRIVAWVAGVAGGVVAPVGIVLTPGPLEEAPVPGLESPMAARLARDPGRGAVGRRRAGDPVVHPRRGRSLAVRFRRSSGVERAQIKLARDGRWHRRGALRPHPGGHARGRARCGRHPRRPARRGAASAGGVALVLPPAAARDRRRHPALPAVRHRPRHQPGPGLRHAHRDSGGGLPRVGAAAAAGAASADRATPTWRSRCRRWPSPALFRPARRPDPEHRRPPLLPPPLRRGSRTLEAFAGRLRHQVDVDAVGADLVAAVHETVQPTHATVWLPGARSRP